jgi:KUP system potassium uptake protein
VALGAVTLAVTGAEALYADMGHSVTRPIQLAWLGWCCPRCSPTTTAKGRCCSAIRRRWRIPFFRLAPGWMLYPLVALATAATVIASQATISGAFSMAQQAALLGLSPRVKIQHTSAASSARSTCRRSTGSSSPASWRWC